MGFLINSTSISLNAQMLSATASSNLMTASLTAPHHPAAHSASKFISTLAIAGSLAGCFAETARGPSVDTDASTDGSTSDASSSDSGMMDTGSTDAGIDMGTPFDGTPSLIGPIDTTLPPLRAYMSWNDGELPNPNNKEISGYRLCHSTSGLASIDDSNECPNVTQIPASRTYAAIDPLQASAQYHWKVRTAYDDNSVSNYSDVANFSTDSSVVGRWRLDDAMGTTAADSSQGGANNGTLNNFDLGTAWTAGLVGTALLFDGNNDYVNLTNIFNFDETDSFSIETWVIRNSGGSVQTLFSKMDFADIMTRRGYRLSYTDTDQLQIQLRSNDASNNLIEVTSMQPFTVMPGDPYQNVTMTYNGSSSATGVQLYVDGIQEPLTTMTDNLSGTLSNSAPTWIGAQVGADFMTADRVLNGSEDEVAIYNRALTAADILNNLCATHVVAGTTPLPTECN